MTTEEKLSVHLERIVMPEGGVPMNASQLLKLCAEAGRADRFAAAQRAEHHNPRTLPDEAAKVAAWVRNGTHVDI